MAVFLFLPKESIYYFAEKKLLENKVILSNETTKEKLFGLDVLNTQVYYENINIASVKNIEIETFLFYTKIKVNNIELTKSFENILPNSINHIEIKHSILEFDKIYINANGSFGELIGFIDILNRNITLELIASNNMKNSYSKLLKSMKLKDGKYYYEYKF